VKLLEEPTDDRRPLMRALQQKAPVAELTRALHIASKPLTRQLILDVLGNKHAKTAVPALIDTLDDKNPKVRFAAADAIGKTFMHNNTNHQNGRLEAGEALYNALQSETVKGVEEILITALGALRYEPALPRIHADLESKDESLRKAAQWALDRFEPSTTEAPPSVLMDVEGHEASTPRPRVAPNLIEEAIQALRRNPDFAAQVIDVAQDPPVTFRIMQDTIQSMQAAPNFYRDAVRAARETPIFVEATIRAMEAAPGFVQEAIRAAQETPSTFHVMEETARAISANPTFVEEAIKAARSSPSALRSTERAVRRAGSMTALQESIRVMAQAQNRIVHGDTLTEALSQLSESIEEAGKEVKPASRAAERKQLALQDVLAFLVLYLILTVAARNWHERLRVPVNELEIFLAALLIWQQSGANRAPTQQTRR
jgi:hypothetical protein